MGNIVILTGAGISAESGIRTFRASDGLWEDHRVEDVATPEGFKRDPRLVHNFYNARRAQLKEVVPNTAHDALTKLQKNHPGDVTIITQNVDDLHERSGAEVIHMHGELKSIFCVNCRRVYSWSEDCFIDTVCEHCHESGTLRPDIVWFGEVPYRMDEITEKISKAEVFVAIGTSGLVYPAAGFVQMAKDYSAKTIEINLEKTAASGYFDQGYYGPATEAVSAWVDAMLQ